MNIFKAIVIGYLLVTVMVMWYMVDRPRQTYGPGVALLSTVVVITLATLVALS